MQRLEGDWTPKQLEKILERLSREFGNRRNRIISSAALGATQLGFQGAFFLALFLALQGDGAGSQQLLAWAVCLLAFAASGVLMTLVSGAQYVVLSFPDPLDQAIMVIRGTLDAVQQAQDSEEQQLIEQLKREVAELYQLLENYNAKATVISQNYSVTAYLTVGALMLMVASILPIML